MDVMILELLKGILEDIYYFLSHQQRKCTQFPIIHSFLLGAQEHSLPLQTHSPRLWTPHPVRRALCFMGIRKYSVRAAMLYVVIGEMASLPLKAYVVTLISLRIDPGLGSFTLTRLIRSCQKLSQDKYLLSRVPSMSRPVWP